MYFSYWSFLHTWFLILCNKCFTTPKRTMFIFLLKWRNIISSNVVTYVEKKGSKRHRQISEDRRHARDTNTDWTYHNTGVRLAFSQNSCVKHNSKKVIQNTLKTKKIKCGLDNVQIGKWNSKSSSKVWYKDQNLKCHNHDQIFQMTDCLEGWACFASLSFCNFASSLFIPWLHIFGAGAYGTREHTGMIF